MGGHLACIGFGGEDWQSAVMEASSESRPAGKSEGGVEHFLWEDPSGARVHYHAKGGDLLCLSPGFRGPTPTAWPVATTAPLPDPDCLYCSGADCDVLDERGGIVTRLTVQFELFPPLQQYLSGPRRFTLELAGFAHWVRIARDEKAFDDALAASGLGGMKLAPNAFIPVGMFSQDKKGVTERATALVAGKAEEVERCRNSRTGAEFWRLRVATLPGTLDVVAPPEAVDAPPEPGRLVLCEVWLSGRPEERRD